MYTLKNEKELMCPLEYGMGLFGGKWKSRILCTIANNRDLRYKEIKKYLPEITDPVLSASLKELTVSELIERISYDEVPPRTEYNITEKGMSLIPVLQSICKLL